MNIREAMNTYNPSLYILLKKGYELEVVLSSNQEEVVGWRAEKEGSSYVGFNPVSLLGLCLIGESLGEEWKDYHSPDIYERLLDQCFDE